MTRKSTKLYVRPFNINDRLGVFAPKFCGWIDCRSVAEFGYGRCRYHLKKDTKALNEEWS